MRGWRGQGEEEAKEEGEEEEEEEEGGEDNQSDQYEEGGDKEEERGVDNYCSEEFRGENLLLLAGIPVYQDPTYVHEDRTGSYHDPGGDQGVIGSWRFEETH